MQSTVPAADGQGVPPRRSMRSRSLLNGAAHRLLLAWPGMDARAFFDPRPIPSAARPSAGEWAFATGNLFALGIGITWGVVR